MAFHKQNGLGTSNREPQEYNRNIVGIEQEYDGNLMGNITETYLPGSFYSHDIPTIFLRSLFGVPVAVLLSRRPLCPEVPRLGL